MAAPGPFEPAASGMASDASAATASHPATQHYRAPLELEIGLDGYSGMDEPYRHATVHHSHQHPPSSQHAASSRHRQTHGGAAAAPIVHGGDLNDFGERLMTPYPQEHPNRGPRRSSGGGARTQQHAPEAGPSQHGGQFGILTPMPVPASALSHSAATSLDPARAVPTPAAQDADEVTDAMTRQSHGHRVPSRIVVDPPDLELWRERLFNVDGRIILTQTQYETYFPHVDNVYSHRSTQRYKRKPFVSHYWDCRMKGRPPGTPKSDDPTKKKRKRTARERDLCDVKIKITEYFPGAQILPETEGVSTAGVVYSHENMGDFDHLNASQQPVTIGPGQKLWTIQRVNGNGGNGKGDGVAGPHKHTLAKSDDIKKNSVQRYVTRQAKEAKATQPVSSQRKATGAALTTAKKHSKEGDLKLYAACFCPFSQRVWIALEAKGLTYQYCEIDPYKRPAPTQLLEANPRGLVPAIRQGDWACAESAVILEYLEDLDSNVPLLPTDPRLKANCRQWIDHINVRLVPNFYTLLRTQDPTAQTLCLNHLQGNITNLMLAADEHGPFFLGNSLSLVDIHFAPFALRLSRVLGPLGKWPGPILGSRWQQWLDALESNAHVQATTSGSELYVETADALSQCRPASA
ncbi:hypothetical protein S7711_02409 [Stachybotrys chartarum IBT 7711]|uniref:GST N-terminal domain-containing protein n=1 Tax=Stachybotrys chartarum (strain CBS 109288 / IBT 7711) TaxID=1280523 RepID=A0A084AQB0_STACB|nr:hypothetical protein S7711_02409 [Stachybotrys chartarum IBT 7711]